MTNQVLTPYHKLSPEGRSRFRAAYYPSATPTPTRAADAPKKEPFNVRLGKLVDDFERFLLDHPKHGTFFRAAKAKQYLASLPKKKEPSLQEKITGSPATPEPTFRERMMGDA